MKSFGKICFLGGIVFLFGFITISGQVNAVQKETRHETKREYYKVNDMKDDYGYGGSSSQDSHSKQDQKAEPTTMNFGKTLSEATTGIHEHLDNPITDISVDGKVKSLITKVIDVLFPVMVVIGVLMAMLGFYKILTSSDENKIKEGMTIILSGVIGIIIMYSAKYLSHALFAHVFNQTSGNSREVREMLEALYNQVWFPFVKIAVYLSLGILVILMMIRVFSYITSQDEDSKKKSLGVIAWTTIGILFITAAKQIVEAVYGKQSTMLTSNSVDNLSKIGTHVLNPKEIPILFSIINWSLGIISFVLLVMILMQTYKMLTKPDDAETYTSLKKTIIYALGGIVLIGSAYLLTNFLILN